MWHTLARLFWISSLLILMLGGATSSSNPANALAPTRDTRVVVSPSHPFFQADKQRSLSLRAASSDFNGFAGVWLSHGTRLDFAKDGTATFDERTYSWCGPGVAQSCDSIDARGFIHPGHREQIQFSYAIGYVAYGTIIASNFHSRGLPVTVELQPDNTLLYSAHTLIALLCGPGAPVGTCGA